MENLKEKLEQLLKEVENQSSKNQYKVYGGKEKSIYVKNQKRVLTNEEIALIDSDENCRHCYITDTSNIDRIKNTLKKDTNDKIYYNFHNEYVGIDKKGKIFIFQYSNIYYSGYDGIINFSGVSKEIFNNAIKNEFSQEKYEEDFETTMKKAIENYGEDFFIATLIENEVLDGTFLDEIKKTLSKMD